MWPVGLKAGLGVESGVCCRKGSGRGGRFFSVPLSLCRRAGGTRRLAVGRVTGRKLTPGSKKRHSEEGTCERRLNRGVRWFEGLAAGQEKLGTERKPSGLAEETLHELDQRTNRS